MHGLTGQRPSAPLALALLLLVEVGGGAARAQEAEEPVFLVTEVQVEGDVGIDPETARDVLANRFGRLEDKIQVRSLGDVKTTLDRSSVQAMLGGEGDDLARLQEYVDVDRVVHGRVAAVGEVIDVSVRVVNVREAAVELAMTRRLKNGADPSLVLAVLDKQADKLLAWVVENYTDGEPSAAYRELAKKKKPTREEVRARREARQGPPAAEPASAPAESRALRVSLLSVAGATLVGAGFTLVAGAGITGALGGFADPVADLVGGPYVAVGLLGGLGTTALFLGVGVIGADLILLE